MGTFMGHALPGTFFAAFGVYWMVRIFDRLLRPKGATTYSNTATFSCTTCCGKSRRWNPEAILKLVAVAVGITGEVVTGMEGGQFKHLGNAQHATMFFAFGLTGVADLLVFYKVPFAVCGLDYVAAFVALLVEGLLFLHHLHGFSMLETRVHILLVYVIFFNAATVLLEMKYVRSRIAALARSYCFLVQGTWFWQIAFILYNPLPDHMWNGDNHDNVMVATLYFSWHLIGNLIGSALIGTLVYCYSRKQKSADVAYGMLLEQRRAHADADANHDSRESDDQMQP